MNPNVQRVMIIERSAVSIMEDVYQDEQFLELKKALEKEKYDEEQIAIFLGNLIGRLIEERAEMPVECFNPIEWYQCAMEAIFEAAYRACPGGLSYFEFVKDLLEQDGIELDEKGLKDESKAFEMEMSKVKKAQTTFEDQVAVYRILHQGNKEENLYRPIMLFDCAEKICRFYLRRRNNSAIKDKLDEISRQELWPLCKRIDPSYFDSEENWEKFQKDYKKYGKAPYSELKHEGLQWLERFTALQEQIINQEPDSLYHAIGLWMLRNKLKYTDIVRTRMIQNLNIVDIQIIADVLIKTIFELVGKCEDFTEKSLNIWNIALKMANDMANECIELGWSREESYRIDFEEVRYIWRQIAGNRSRLFDPDEAYEKINKNIVAHLQKEGYDSRKRRVEGMFLELSLCCYGFTYGRTRIERIDRVIQVIFNFLDECRKIEVIEGEIIINAELKRLKEGLEKEGITISDYDRSLLVKSPEGKFDSSGYFKSCYKKRYQRLLQVIKMMREKITKLEEEDTGEKGNNSNPEKNPVEFIANKYLDLILIDRGNNWKVSSELSGDLDKVIFSAVIQQVFPAYMTDQAAQQYYTARDRAIEIARKCEFASYMGF